MPKSNYFWPGCFIFLWKGTLILIGVLIQPLGWLTCSSSQSSSLFEPSLCSPLSCASISHQLFPATSSGQNSGCPMILTSCSRLAWDFLSPPFQYHYPIKNDDRFGYGWTEQDGFVDSIKSLCVICLPGSWLGGQATKYCWKSPNSLQPNLSTFLSASKQALGISEMEAEVHLNLFVRPLG